MLVLTLGFAVLIAFGNTYVAGEASRRATDEFDAALLTKARILMALTEQEAGVIEFDYKPHLLTEFEVTERPEYFQFYLDDGTMLLRSPRLSEDLPYDSSKPSESTIQDLELPDGRTGKFIQLSFEPRGPVEAGDDEDAAAAGAEQYDVRSVAVVVARGRERLDAHLAEMYVAITGAGGLAILIGAFLVWRALTAGFRPIDSIASKVSALGPESLGSRIEEPRTPRELAPVVKQINALLERLDDSFQRERRFTGNVAHELRTPIAELRALATVGMRWPGDEGSVSEFFQDVKGLILRC
jgi:signal transduction histidine kinase